MFDERKAQRVITFIECLKHTKGEFHGQYFKLLPWQKKIVSDVFGTVRDDKPDTRQYSTVYVEIPKKQGKSELGAAIALNMLCNDDEWKAEVYSCAADRAQASLVFDVAADMVRQSPALSKRIKIIPSMKRMVYTPTGSAYQVLSSDVACLHADTIVQLADGSIKRAEDVRVGDRLLSYDGLTPVFDEVLSVREEEPSEILEIATHHGRKTAVTLKHPFYSMLPGKEKRFLTHIYHWVEAQALEKDSRVGVALGWPNHEQPESAISTLEAWSLGAWAGDGDCTHFRFINPDPEVWIKLGYFFTTIGSGIKAVYSTRQLQSGKNEYQEPIEHLIVGCGKRVPSPGREWVRRHFGQASKARTKVIPEAVWTGGPDVWAAFLAGYIDTDGCVSNEKGAGSVSICSVSEEMTSGCQILFARLGINASTVGKYLVRVSGKPQLRRLWSLIEPYMMHTRKRTRLQWHAEKNVEKLQRASESDKVVSIKSLGIQKSYSFEMKRYHTHATDGLITHNTKHGLNVSAVIFDELHTQPNRDLYDVMTQGSGDARKQPLWVFLTTAGTDRNSICWEVHQKALDCIEGRKHDERFYPVIFGLPDTEDWTNEENWYKANPSLGYTIQIDKVRDAYHKALETPADENMFRQLRLNQWVKQSIRWMPMATWDECGGVVNPRALEGRECYAGLDLSSTSDLTAFVLIFPPRDEEEPYTILPFFWLPEDQMKLRIRRDHVMYDVWEKQGYIKATEGNVVHYGFIEQFIINLGEKYNIREIAYDRWNAAMMVQALENDGFTMVPFGQGFRDMSPPTKELMRLVLEHKINHGGHPVLRWNMDNAYVRTDPAGNQKIDKEKSTEKVDGAVAMVMGLDRAMRHMNDGGSVYDDRGLLFV